MQEGETKRRELAFDAATLKLAGVDEIDPDAEGVERLLETEKTRTSRKVREDESRIEILKDAQDSLEATGLAGIDKDVRLVVERLREAGLHDAQAQCAMLVAYCDSEGIPVPSVIVGSGRGLYAKWLLRPVLSRRALPYWNAVQAALAARLGRFGTDTGALDGSRVLRLVGVLRMARKWVMRRGEGTRNT